MGGLKVLVNEEVIGHIDEHGFFIDPTAIRGFLRVSSSDLRKIAEKVEEMQRQKLQRRRMTI